MSAEQLMAAYRSLHDSTQTTYILSAERTLLRVNPAWQQFALANGGAEVLTAWPRGSSVLAALPAPLRAFYTRGFQHTCQTGKRWEHVYECSSDQLFRKFRIFAIDPAKLR